VRTPLSEYRFSTLGAAPIGVRLLEHPALGTKRGGQVELVRSGTPLVSYEVVSGADTISLGTTPFSVSGDPAAAGSGAVPLQFRAAIPGGGEANISYSFVPDNYVVRVRGRITGRPLGSLLVRMPKGIQSAEADTIDDQRHLAYVYKPVRDDARSAPFGKLEGKERVEPGPFTWVGSKTKYFLVALLTEPGQLPFGNVLLRGGTKTGKNVVTADAAVLRPLSPDSTFTFEIYAGPQEWRRLHVLGRDLENANPYGGFLQGFVQPFATIVMRVLLWMHDRLALSYGWVLVIFGIVVRLILWPLNQSAMRTSLRMQRIQPELMEVQKRYRQQPEKAHQEMMRVYKDHNLSPFSMFSGCLPMLLPMPVLFALFFVFQNTIEFRGVSFLWLPDISLKDPYYIIPVIMGASMYLLSWIGMRGVPPNPQTKMMAYVFPGLMTFLFLNFPSGLNLYYAVQNIAALPQQWLISRERKKAGPPVQSPAS
jgi:YidC/Oxa1 family membrane protein insertase